MASFNRYNNKVAIDHAATIKSEIYGEDCFFKLSENLLVDEYILGKSLRPYKLTILQKVIKDSILEGVNYSIKKTPDETYKEIYLEFYAFDVDYIKYENFRGDDFNDYICDLYEKEVISDLMENVFTILYSDREIMRQFNIIISEKIRVLKLNQWPKFLKRDGVMIRCTYWPKWLQNGLFRREQGHCACCQKDLTGLLSNGNNIAIDHIVPLNMGGVNDPTNLKILCSDCNLKKGGDKIDTSDLYSRYW